MGLQLYLCICLAAITLLGCRGQSDCSAQIANCPNSTLDVATIWEDFDAEQLRSQCRAHNARSMCIGALDESCQVELSLAQMYDDCMCRADRVEAVTRDEVCMQTGAEQSAVTSCVTTFMASILGGSPCTQVPELLRCIRQASTAACNNTVITDLAAKYGALMLLVSSGPVLQNCGLQEELTTCVTSLGTTAMTEAVSHTTYSGQPEHTTMGSGAGPTTLHPGLSLAAGAVMSLVAFF